MHYLIIAVLAFGLSLMGCEGKTGPAGPSGSTGQAGPQGVAGPQGSTGPQGPAGADGAQGPQGETGPVGPTGPAGADGAPGEKGDQGEQGPKGDTGETGPAGPPGADGTPGEKGDTGETGPAGADGAPGEKGEKGDQGDPGEDGEDGAPGEKGEKGDQGDPGEDGEDGAQGPTGPRGPAGPPGKDADDPDPAILHSIALRVSGEDADLGDGDTRDLTAKMSLTVMATPMTQSGDTLDVALSWMSSDEPVATVTADEDNSRMATVMGVRRGDAEITVEDAERGFSASFMVMVHNAPESIVVTGDYGSYEVGGSPVTLTATAYDAKQDDMKSGIEGNEVEGVTFGWMSSKPDKVGVKADDDNSSMAEVSFKNVGSAEITAYTMVGDKKITSNKVKYTVFDVVEPERRIVVSTANAPFTRYYHPAVADDPTISGTDEVRPPKLSTAKNRNAADGTEIATDHSDIVITVTLQYRGLGTDGELTWLDAADGLQIGVSISDTDIIGVADDHKITVDSTATNLSEGQASFTIGVPTGTYATSPVAAGTAKKAGRILVTFSEAYSDDEIVVVTLKNPEAQ